VSFAPPFFCHQNAKIHSKKKIKITIIIRIKAFIIQALFAFYGCNDKGMKKALWQKLQNFLEKYGWF